MYSNCTNILSKSKLFQMQSHAAEQILVHLVFHITIWKLLPTDKYDPAKKKEQTEMTDQLAQLLDVKQFSL